MWVWVEQEHPPIRRTWRRCERVASHHGRYQDYFRYLQSLDGFWNHAWHNSLMTTFAVGMFFSDKTTMLPFPYAHQMDCHCGVLTNLTCVVRAPGSDDVDDGRGRRERERLKASIAYLRENKIGGLLECWTKDRRAAAVCAETSVLHGLSQCVG